MNMINAQSNLSTPDRLIFTDRAIHQAYELISQENNKNLKLRIFVVGGGCAGLQYGFAFDKSIQPDDIVIKKSIQMANTKDISISLLIDPISFLYLSEAEVDYVDTRFVVNNPKIKTTCGCGRSFLTPDE